MRTRAFRRNQLERKKKQARKVYPHDKNATWANHLQGCSCYMCGNPRKWWKSKTLQEIKAEEDMKEQLMDRGQDGNADDC